MNKTIVVLFSLLLSTAVLSQEFYDFSPPTAPSPTAHELGKYGAMPVDYYRGTPQISIPLYTLEAGTMSLPISLSYHASGIRVNDMASWVGLGWSLNAGGVISVNIRGISDFTLDNNNNPKRIDLREHDELELENTPTYSQLVETCNGVYDSEPDIYNYNFCGYSGQFVLDLDDNNKVHFIKNHGGISFECYLVDKKFIAKDNYGRQYIFDVLEWTEKDQYTAAFDYLLNKVWAGSFTKSYPSEITSFYLSKIILENNLGEITFTYSNEPMVYWSGYSGTISTEPSVQSGGDGCDVIKGGQNVFSQYEFSIAAKKLSTIEYDKNDVQIQFTADYVRPDLNNCNALTEIEIFQGTNRIKAFELNYGTFSSLPGPPASDMRQYNDLDKRLKLESLQEISWQSKNAPYEFTYYGEEMGETILPPRNSFDGFDYWGYCNKDVTSTHITSPKNLFPSIQSSADIQSFDHICVFTAAGMNGNPGVPTATETLSNYGTPATFNGSDRSPNEACAKAFTLEEIKYPTGGSTSFEFEGHTYNKIQDQAGSGDCGGLRVASMTDKSLYSSDVITNFDYGNGGVLFAKPWIARPKFDTNPSYGKSDFYLCGSVGYSSACGYTLFSNSIDPLNGVGGEYITYQTVTVTKGNSKWVYHYDSGYEFPNDYNYHYVYVQNPTVIQPGDEPYEKIYGYIPYSSKHVYPFFNSTFSGPAFARGKLSLIEYKRIGTPLDIPIKSEAFTYDTIGYEKIIGNTVFHEDYTDVAIINVYNHHTGKSFLKEKVTTTYDKDGNNPIVETIEYTYDQDYELPRSEQVTLDNNTKKKTTFSYPHDYEIPGAQYFIEEMLEENMIDYPIEIVQSLIKGNTEYVTAATLLDYNGSDVPNKPKAYYGLEIHQPITDFAPFNRPSSNVVDADSRYGLKVEVDVYDSHGNILQYHKPNDIDISYVWGYDQSYPIATAVNAQRNQIAYTGFESSIPGNPSEAGDWYCSSGSIHSEGAFGNQGYKPNGNSVFTSYSIPAGDYILSMYCKNNGASGVVTVTGQSIEPFWGGDDWNYNEREINLSTAGVVELVGNGTVIIDEVKLYPVDAHLTTYGYSPLVGMTSSTAADYTSTYYDYDSFKRLQSISNDDNNIVEHYEYNYGLQGDKADLIFDFIGTHETGGEPASFNPGSTIGLSFQYANRGGDASINDPFRVRYYISEDAQYSTNDIEIPGNPTNFRSVPASGSHSFYNEQLSIPTNTTSGDYYIVYRIDSENDIDESHEQNNCRSTRIIIN